MAISFVGSYAGTHAATSAQSVAFTNLRDASNAQPTLQAGDIVLVAVENASTLNRSTGGGADVLVPSGYTGIDAHDYRDDSNDSNFRVSYKFMGGTPDSSVSIPASNATTAGVAYAISVWRGVDPNNPLDVAAVRTGGTNTGVANAGAITPVTAGAIILAFGGAAVAAGAVFTNPAGMSATTNHFRSATITSTTNDANVAVAAKTDWASGAFDPAAFGGSTSTNTGSWSAITIALRPILNPITANAAPSLGTIQSASAAKAVVDGMGSGTLNVFTATSAATVSTAAIHASASPTLATFAASATARAPVRASASAALGGFISAAAARALVDGLGGGTLNAFSCAAGAAVRIAGSTGPSLAAFGAVGAASALVRGNVAAQMGGFTAGGTIGAPIRLAGDVALDPFASAAAVEALVAGAGDGLLNPFAAVGAIAPRITAMGAPALDDITGTASAVVAVRATGDGPIDGFQATGQIGSPTGPIAAMADISLGLFVGALPPASDHRWLSAPRPVRIVAGPPRPSRHLAPNLQPRQAGR